MKFTLCALLTTAVVLAQQSAPAPAAAQPKAPAKAQASAIVTVPSYKSLKFGPAPQVKAPEIPSFTLANGMRVYLLENHELPLVSGFALVRTGNLFDPKDKIGLAELTEGLKQLKAFAMSETRTVIPLSKLPHLSNYETLTITAVRNC